MRQLHDYVYSSHSEHLYDYDISSLRSVEATNRFVRCIRCFNPVTKANISDLSNLQTQSSEVLSV